MFANSQGPRLVPTSPGGHKLNPKTNKKGARTSFIPALLMIVLGFALVGQAATATYTFHDSTWNDTKNDAEDAGQFLISLFPLVIKLGMYGLMIALGYKGYQKLSKGMD